MFKYLLLVFIFIPSIVVSQVDSTLLFENSKKSEQGEKLKSSKTVIQNSPSETESSIQGQKIQSSAALKVQFTTVKNQASKQRKQRNPTPEQQLKMNQAVAELQMVDPESFDFHLCKYLSGNHKVEWVSHLKKAEALQPNNSDVHAQFAAYYIIKGEEQNALEYLKKLNTNNRLSQTAMHYSTDLLLSVPTNGTLITHGFEDTYGTIYVQLKNNFRRDVEIISLEFLQSQTYVNSIKSKGYVMPESSIINAAYLESFCRNNSNKSIALSLTLPKEYFYPMQSNLFVTGLTFAYQLANQSRQFERNEELWFRTLTKRILKEPAFDKSNMLSANYLPMLIYLRNVYQINKDTSVVSELNRSIEQIAEKSKTTEKIKKIEN